MPIPEVIAGAEPWHVEQGDCLAVMGTMPDRCVQCCVTSPPYWTLRSYLDKDDPNKANEIGSESTPEEYVATMVMVFREVKRILRDDGTLWLNLGDSYAGGGGGNYTKGNKNSSGQNQTNVKNRSDWLDTAGVQAKSLFGIPWRVALALQEDGWVLRSDIIWGKKSPMPESVTDRCTKSHEYVFLLTKKPTYYFDAEAIKEESSFDEGTRRRAFTSPRALAMGRPASGNEKDGWVVETGVRNKRSVWNADDETALLRWLANQPEGEELLARYVEQSANKADLWWVTTEPLKLKHYAAFPSMLVEPCILAGTSAYGSCSACGSPWRRITKKTKLKRERPNDLTKRTGDEGTGNHCANTVAGVAVETLGWEPTCKCNASVVPSIVFDPFTGSGTTGIVARELQRRFIGADLSVEYAAMSRKRIGGATPMGDAIDKAVAKQKQEQPSLF